MARVRCSTVIVTSDFLVHATGVSALVINVVAMASTCEKSLRVQSAMAGLVWALNNFLLGAYTAAALSLVSASRTTTSAVVLRSAAQVRRTAFISFAGLTLCVAAVTWDSRSSLLITIAALLSTYAMFYLRGASLRWSMLVVSALWMDHAWSHGSWEQIAGNALPGLAALYGVWRVRDSEPRGRLSPGLQAEQSSA
ncbi:MAG: YgjV family protein [Caldimonas sp.]